MDQQKMNDLLRNNSGEFMPLKLNPLQPAKWVEYTWERQTRKAKTILPSLLRTLGISWKDELWYILLIEIEAAVNSWRLKNNLLKFFNWVSLHARLNSHYKQWSYKEKKKRKERIKESSLERAQRKKVSKKRWL